MLQRITASLAWIFSGVSLCAILFTFGCTGGKPSHIPDLVKCSVKVTYEGNPVEGAKVLFAPNAGQFSAAGTTDATGVAVMKTEGIYDGAVVGEYSVSVTKMEVVQFDIGPSPTNLKEYAEYEAKLKKIPKPKNFLPEKYSSFTKSGLKASVAAGATEPIPLDLK